MSENPHMSKRPREPEPQYRLDRSARYSRRSPWVDGADRQQGVGPFNRVPPGWRPRVRRSRWVHG